MKVSIVIPTLNAGPLFEEVLKAVKAQEIDAEVELVIVDSESDDGTAELARKYAGIFFQVRREEFNHGDTRNLAASRSSGELVALLVQDATPADPHWLKNLADNFSDPRVAGSYSRQIPRPDCNPLLRIRLKGWGAGKPERRVQEITDKGVCGTRVCPDSQAGGLAPRKLTPDQIKEVIDTFSFDNVSSMIRRSVWEQVNFPRRKFAEDIGWCREVLGRGYQVVYQPESMVVHSHNKSLWYEFKRIYLDHQNWWQVGRFRIFNRRRELIGASLGGTFRMIKSLGREGARGFPLIYWSGYALFYVFSQNLAQYMGGWSDRWKEKYPWYAKIDKWISQGV